jgi:hypothetical protein
MQHSNKRIEETENNTIKHNTPGSTKQRIEIQSSKKQYKTDKNTKERKTVQQYVTQHSTAIRDATQLSATHR